MIALFKDIGAPKRLTILVEGESLFNDATAIVVAGLFISVLSLESTAAPGTAILEFFKVFLGGVVIGLLVARAMIAVMTPFRRNAISAVTLSIVMPFMAFVLAEHFLHVSGVMAAVVCGLLVGSYGRRVIPPVIYDDIKHLWEQISYWATGLIFLLVGLTVPRLLADNPFNYLDEAVFVFVVATLVRFALVFLASPMLTHAKLAARLSRGFQAIMVWGGLRGAVSLALTLLVLDTPNIAAETQQNIAALVTIFVLTTLFLQATTIGWVMRLLGLRRLSTADQLIRERSLHFVHAQVGEDLDGYSQERGLNDKDFADLRTPYNHEGEDDALDDTAADTISLSSWVRTGLLLALAQERQYYLDSYGEGAISAEKRRIILDRIDDVMDALRAANCVDEDLTPLSRVLIQSVRHTPAFERALRVYRRTGLTTPMANTLTLRFNGLTAIRTAIARQEKEGLGEITALLPARAQAPFADLYGLRKRKVSDALEALTRQHPNFAMAVERYNFRQASLRFERKRYAHLFESGLIGQDIYDELVASLDQRLGPRPKLELRYNRYELLSSLPLFAGARKRDLRHLARHLRVVFLPPGETLFAVGDAGDSMYFIADGAMTLTLNNDEIIGLGTGDFFGEVSLLTQADRIATAVSDTYSTLLRLDQKDFEDVMKRSPDLAQEIEKVAHERVDFSRQEQHHHKVCEQIHCAHNL